MYVVLIRLLTQLSLICTTACSSILNFTVKRPAFVRVFLYDAVIDKRYDVMAPRKKHTGFFPWIDPQDHNKGFKLNFSEVTYIEIGRTPEGYKQAEFVALRHPEFALDYDYPKSFYLTTEGLILKKLPSGTYVVIAKTDNG